VSASHSHSNANYLHAAHGLKSWLLTLDHKRIGIMYLIGIVIMFFVAGLFAVLLRTELFTAGQTMKWVDADMYNRLFTLHGGIMVFIVIIPGIPAAMGNFILPIMLGAKDVAFPRLNLASWYMWLIGTLFLVSSLFFGGVDTGWTFYAPYSTEYAMRGVIPVLIGAFILGFSSIFTGLNFIVTIHKLRRPEMGWFQMPLFLWAIYSTAVIQVLATPVLGITLLLLLVDRVLGGAFFSPQFGGDPVMMQHFFWFYSHPAVYIMILPAMGVMSELISVHSHKHIFGYRFIAFSSVALAIFGFLVWGHHMFVSGQSQLVSMVFSALTFSVAIPSAVKVFNWLATMYKGSIAFTSPMLHAMSFMWIFGIGGLTGLFLGTMAVDVHLHDTYFVVAHFHYVMAGTIFVIFGAIHHWWPKMFGRMYNEFWGNVATITAFIGFNLVFFVQFVLGTRGMPRRYYDYTKLMPQHPEFQLMHQISTIGSYVMGIGLIIMAWNLLVSLKRGRLAPANPWGGSSLEWHTTSPPPVENFHGTPHAGDPYDYEDLQYDPSTGGYISRKRAGLAAARPAPAH
jgi:cytochrome c oxidase subunit I